MTLGSMPRDLRPTRSSSVSCEVDNAFPLEDRMGEAYMSEREKERKNERTKEGKIERKIKSEKYR